MGVLEFADHSKFFASNRWWVQYLVIYDTFSRLNRMSTIRHHRVVPRALGPLNLLENIAEVPDQQVTKTGESSIFCLSSSVSVTVSQASTITAEAGSLWLILQRHFQRVICALLILRWSVLYLSSAANSEVSGEETRCSFVKLRLWTTRLQKQD